MGIRQSIVIQNKGFRWSLRLSQGSQEIVSSTEEILPGNDYLVENLLSVEKGQFFLRAESAKCLLATVAYLAKSNSSYSSASWMYIRGDIRHADFKDRIGTTRCCDETGFHAKLSTFWAEKSISEDANAERAVAKTLLTTSGIILKQNGFSTNDAEQAFSSARSSGLGIVCSTGGYSFCFTF